MDRKAWQAMVHGVAKSQTPVLDDKIRIHKALSRGKDVPDITRWDLIGIKGKLTLSPKEPIIYG